MDHADEVARSFLDHGKLPEAGPVVDRPGGRNDLPHGCDRGFGDGFGWLPVDEEDITEPGHVLAVDDVLDNTCGLARDGHARGANIGRQLGTVGQENDPAEERRSCEANDPQRVTKRTHREPDARSAAVISA